MNKVRVVLTGAQPYWYHSKLISILEKRTGWNERKCQEFIQKNYFLAFNNYDPQAAKALLDDLNAAGFEQLVEEKKGEIRVTLSLPYERELMSLREEVASLSSRLGQLEALKGIAAQRSGVEQTEAYQRLTREIHQAGGAEQVTAAPLKPEPLKSTEREAAESTIGKYWLSRIGVFSLVLGIAFFLSYTFQYLGALGKVILGILLGSALVHGGNYLARQKNYFKWAMGIIGGGWSIVYFTIFAAYHIPQTKVIDHPLVAFGFLTVVAASSIAQAIRHRSQALIFFSYFLAYLAMATSEVTTFTLAATILLAGSTVIVTKRFEWTWPFILSCLALYLTHWIWVEPSIYFSNSPVYPGQESLSEAIFLPFTGDEWRIYPLTVGSKSSLHQLFLCVYWLMFTAMGLYPTTHKTVSRNRVMLVLTLMNNLFFSTSYIHHLHVYYPSIRFLFPLVMGIVYFGFSLVEQRRKEGLLSDVYLAFSVSMFALVVPMYFDGPWVTYGWVAASSITGWLGIRHHRFILRIASWVLSVMILVRLILFDFSENKIIFQVFDPIRLSFVIFLVSAAGFFLNYFFYQTAKEVDRKEQKNAENLLLISSCSILGSGFVLGGWYTFASLVLALLAFFLIDAGITKDRKVFQIAGSFFLVITAIRMLTVDCHFDLAQFFSDTTVMWRLIFGAVAIGVLLFVAEWVRFKRTEHESIGDWLLQLSSYVCMALILAYLHSRGVRSWVSLIWGVVASLYVIAGFSVREKVYRWCGLIVFGWVVLRLFLHDFAKLDLGFKIISFMGLGIVLIAVSWLYNYYSKRLLEKS